MSYEERGSCDRRSNATPGGERPCYGGGSAGFDHYRRGGDYLQEKENFYFAEPWHRHNRPREQHRLRGKIFTLKGLVKKLEPSDLFQGREGFPRKEDGGEDITSRTRVGPRKKKHTENNFYRCGKSFGIKEDLAFPKISRRVGRSYEEPAHHIGERGLSLSLASRGKKGEVGAHEEGKARGIACGGTTVLTERAQRLSHGGRRGLPQRDKSIQRDPRTHISQQEGKGCGSGLGGALHHPLSLTRADISAKREEEGPEDAR